MARYSGPVGVLGITILAVPGAGQTTAAGINSRGQVVGHFTDSGGRHHGFLYEAGSYSQPLDYPGAQETYLLGINDEGQIAGSTAKDGFVYSSGTFGPLLSYPKSQRTSLEDINNYGDIVGTYQDAAARNHAFLYRAGEFYALPWQGKEESFASGINDGGQIAGGYADAAGTHGFVYLDNAGVFSRELTYPGTTVTYPHGIDNRGRIVAHFVDKNGVDQALLCFAAGFHQLHVPGAKSVGALDINDQGQIVGNFGDAKGLHAYLGTVIA